MMRCHLTSVLVPLCASVSVKSVDILV